jgi:hypothetical protein
MENLFVKIQAKFRSLKNYERIAFIIALLLFSGIFFFVSGIAVGDALYKVNN